MAAPFFRRRFPAPGLFAALFALAASSAAGATGLQPPEARVLEFTISDLDEDHLDFLTGWDRRGGDLLEGFARGTARFRVGPGFSPVLPGLTASGWLWLESAAAPEARPVAGTRRFPRRESRESARPAPERTRPRVRPAAAGAGPRAPRVLPAPSATVTGTGRWAPPVRRAPPTSSASGTRARPRGSGAPRPAGRSAGPSAVRRRR